MKDGKKIILLLTILWSWSQPVLSQSFDPILKKLIVKAIDKNHDIKIDEYKIKQTQIDRQKAYKTFLPHLSLNASYTHLNDDIILDPQLQLLLLGTEKLLIKEQLGIPFNAALPPNIPVSDIPPITNQNLLKSSADIHWVIFSGFEASYAIKATKHKEKALTYAKKIALKNTIKEVANTYDQLALLEASEKVLKAAQKQLNLQEKKAKSALKNGLAIQLDLKRIALARQNLNIKRNDLQRQKVLLQTKLIQLTGENMPVIKALHPDLKPLLLPESIIDKTIKPIEISSLEEAVKAKNYQQKMSYSKYIPKIAIKGHYELTDKDLSMLDPKWYVAIGAKWQLFDGLKAYDNARKTKLEAKIYQEKIVQTRDLLNLATKNAKLNYEIGLKEIDMQHQAVDLAKSTYDMVSKQYKNGLTDITKVLTALTNWQTANFNLQKAYYQQRQAAIELLYRKDLLDIINN